MIYIHVGMHKTGTTFLQQDVFPRVLGLSYYKPGTPLDGYLRLDTQKNCLISNERLAGRLWATSDQVESSVKRLSEIFPDAQIIMGFRRQEGFIVSSYKQYLHQGGVLTFKEYFDFYRNCGFMKREQFLFAPRIELISHYFKCRPFVFLLDELRNDQQGLFSDLGELMGVEFPVATAIVTTAANKGVTFQQARVLRWLNQYDKTEFNPSGRWKMYNTYTRLLRIYPRALVQYWLRFLPDGAFFNDVELDELNQFYAADWEFVKGHKNSRRSLFA